MRRRSDAGRRWRRALPRWPPSWPRAGRRPPRAARPSSFSTAPPRASGPRPRRTVLFALFGSEEQGGYGAAYFRERPPIPLDRIAANIEFEEIGLPDPRVPPHTLWLTGWERSDLGPTLAAHGARLV